VFTVVWICACPSRRWTKRRPIRLAADPSRECAGTCAALLLGLSCRSVCEIDRSPWSRSSAPRCGHPTSSRKRSREKRPCVRVREARSRHACARAGRRIAGRSLLGSVLWRGRRPPMSALLTFTSPLQFGRSAAAVRVSIAPRLRSQQWRRQRPSQGTLTQATN
jgi:hypothetical protein